MDYNAPAFEALLQSPHTEVEVDLAALSNMGAGQGRTWRLGPRQLNRHFLVAVVHGHAHIRIGKGPTAIHTELQKGSVFWLSPGIEHELWPVPGHRLPRAYHLRFRLLHDGERCGFDDAAHVLHDAGHLRELIDRLRLTMRYPDHLAQGRLRALLLLIYAELVMDRQHTGNGLSQRQQHRLLQYVDRHIKRPLDSAELARVTGLSRDYFCRQFRETFGCSPRQWLNEQRLRHSADVLLARPHERIGSIAEELGWCDQYHFTRQFSKTFGLSPGAYRHKNA